MIEDTEDFSLFITGNYIFLRFPVLWDKTPCRWERLVLRNSGTTHPATKHPAPEDQNSHKKKKTLQVYTAVYFQKTTNRSEDCSATDSKQQSPR